MSGEPDIHYAMEDSYDHSNSYEVGPLFGGQNYDAQFLGVSWSGSILSFAISSGQRQDNGPDYYAPGDLMIGFGGALYGIELGGYADAIGTHGNYQNFASPPNANLAGWTFELDTNGYTDTATAVPNQAVGSIWKDTGNFIRGLPYSVSQGFYGIKTQIHLGSPVSGLAAVAANFELDGNNVALQDPVYQQVGHAWIEGQIDMSLLGNPDDIDFVRWAPSCANDRLALTVVFPNQPPVPEPASVVIWGLLGLAVGGYSWRRKRMAKAA